MKDILSAQEVEVVVDSEGKLWVNTENGCVLRIGKCTKVFVDNECINEV